MSAIRRMFQVSMAGVALSLGVAGCATQRPDVIPASAQVQTSGTSETNFTPPTDGTAYVYDQSSNRLLWSGPVKPGQTVHVDPQKNQIAIGNQVVATRTLTPGDRVDIYYEPMPGAAQPAAMPMERQPMPPPQPQPAPGTYYQGQYPQGTGVNQQNPGNPPPPGSTVSGPGVLVTPSVTVTPQQQQPQQQQWQNQQQLQPSGGTGNPSVNVVPSTQPGQP